ncbi:hypothetical protein [Pelagibacterium sp. H642]|uniref:hypothetical protein n=1 Tax=Pelagibacterium sp. H642 TaxID=1881069 RepID=UPI002814C3A9|nr:hypothetical protein [Pelagibacterium sp. H642]WMT91000.1 hypothetical protein NO934_01725 [Pelagibacterium sp. H642]
MKSVGRAAGAILGIVAGLWVLLYVMFWYQRTGCLAAFDRACNDALLVWLERFVSLGWVRDYQTLLAGFFALVAGAFVWLAALHQTSHQVAQRKVERAETFAQYLRSLIVRVIEIEHAIIEEIDCRPKLRDLQSELPTISAYSPQLSMIIMSSLDTIFESWDDFDDGTSDFDGDGCRLVALAIFHTIAIFIKKSAKGEIPYWESIRQDVFNDLSKRSEKLGIQFDTNLGPFPLMGFNKL